MPVLSDHSLSVLYPDATDIQPCSINLRLGDKLLYWPEWVTRNPRIDQSHLWREESLRDLGDGPCWTLRPNVRYLADTVERVVIRPDTCGQIATRSSWARDGLATISGNAGFLDAGFEGTVTLELSVIGSDLIVWPGASVAQLIVHRLTTPAERPYGHPDRASKYQGQSEPTASRTWMEAAS